MSPNPGAQRSASPPAPRLLRSCWCSVWNEPSLSLNISLHLLKGLSPLLLFSTLAEAVALSPSQRAFALQHFASRTLCPYSFIETEFTHHAIHSFKRHDSQELCGHHHSQLSTCSSVLRPSHHPIPPSPWAALAAPSLSLPCLDIS